MIINMTGGGGLKLKVVGGTTQPTSPAENTVWVNTDTEISGWAFSSSEPENPAQGMVWIKTGASGKVSFNVLNKNGLDIYPSACYQWDGSSFVRKTATIYIDGQWTGLELTLVPNLTDYASDKWTKSNATVSATDKNLTVSNNSSGGCYARVPVDVTPYSDMTLAATVARTSGGNTESYSYLGLFADSGLGSLSVGFSYTHKGGSNTSSSVNQNYDISALTGVYYLAYKYATGGNPSSSSTYLANCVATSIKFS